MFWVIEGGGDTRGVSWVIDAAEEYSTEQREHRVALEEMVAKRSSTN